MVSEHSLKPLKFYSLSAFVSLGRKTQESFLKAGSSGGHLPVFPETVKHTFAQHSHCYTTLYQAHAVGPHLTFQ